jgi:ABC-2 type transport system permease protein
VAVHDGAWGAAAARLAIAAGTIALLWLIWTRSLAKALVTPPVGGGKGARSKGLGWFGRFPATPVWAIAARCTTYWIRDPRYAAGISVIFLMPVILWLPARSSENLELLLLAGPVVAWMLAFSVSNDVGYDYTAFALHVATGTSGRDDRWGRALPVLTFGGVVVVLIAVLTLALSGRWDLTVPLLGICLGTLGLGLGVSSVASAALVYPVPKPGESPLKSPQGAAMATMLAQTLAMLITLLLALPLVGLGIWAMISGSLLAGWATLAVGVAEGAILLVVGIRIGARTFDRRAPELLQQVQAFP